MAVYLFVRVHAAGMSLFFHCRQLAIRRGGYVSPGVCLSVCLSLSNFAYKPLIGSSRNDFFYQRRISLDKDKLIKFRKSSGRIRTRFALAGVYSLTYLCSTCDLQWAIHTTKVKKVLVMTETPLQRQNQPSHKSTRRELLF